MLKNLAEEKHLFLLTLIVFLIVLTGTLGVFRFQITKEGTKISSTFNEKLFVDNQVKIGIESPDLTLIQKNSLAGISSPQIFSSKVLGALTGEDLAIEEKKEIIEYVIERGDSLGTIAADFNISLNTLLWANELNKGSVITPGQKLVILPVSGVIHHVRNRDTLSEIAETYGARTKEITAFNDLSEGGEIFAGDILIVPDGIKPFRSQIVSSQTVSYNQIPVASSYFICPISSPYKITQGLHWYNAIDFANLGGSCGKPIFAAAGGKVLKIKYGYNSGAGNYVRIIHPNGLITHYGHMQKVLIGLGQEVSQGEIIGLMGYTGHTIPSGPGGCHVHFGVYSSQGSPPRNPFAQ
jgi:LysM repeat protein